MAAGLSRVWLDACLARWSHVANGIFPSFSDIEPLKREGSNMIGVLVFPDFQLLDAAGAISVFEIASRLAGRPASIRVLAEVPGGVRSSSGVEMLARSLRSPGAFSTLIVAGGEGVIAASRS